MHAYMHVYIYICVCVCVYVCNSNIVRMAYNTKNSAMHLKWYLENKKFPVQLATER